LVDDIIITASIVVIVAYIVDIFAVFIVVGDIPVVVIAVVTVDNIVTLSLQLLPSSLLFDGHLEELNQTKTKAKPRCP